MFCDELHCTFYYPPTFIKRTVVRFDVISFRTLYEHRRWLHTDILVCERVWLLCRPDARSRGLMAKIDSPILLYSGTRIECTGKTCRWYTSLENKRKDGFVRWTTEACVFVIFASYPDVEKTKPIYLYSNHFKIPSHKVLRSPQSRCKTCISKTSTAFNGYDYLYTTRSPLSIYAF